MKGGMGLHRKIFLAEATDKSKINSIHHRIFFDVSLYPLSFIANTPFLRIHWDSCLYIDYRDLRFKWKKILKKKITCFKFDFDYVLLCTVSCAKKQQ